MLVLSRMRQERIFIAQDITVVVLDITGNKVRLGIEAPRGVAINREEVHQGIDRGVNRKKGKAVT